VLAGRLRVGDLVTTAAGARPIVAIRRSADTEVYTLTTEPDHNFVANSVVVHNKP
jgi:intein/homing endonuclease